MDAGWRHFDVDGRRDEKRRGQQADAGDFFFRNSQHGRNQQNRRNGEPDSEDDGREHPVGNVDREQGHVTQRA
jgi:hypothetical protein